MLPDNLGSVPDVSMRTACHALQRPIATIAHRWRAGEPLAHAHEPVACRLPCAAEANFEGLSLAITIN